MDGADAVTAGQLKHDPLAPRVFAAPASERVEPMPWVATAFLRSPRVVANLAPDLNRHSWDRFVWPQAKNGTVSLTAPQLSMLLEGIDWRMPI